MYVIWMVYHSLWYMLLQTMIYGYGVVHLWRQPLWGGGGSTKLCHLLTEGVSKSLTFCWHTLMGGAQSSWYKKIFWMREKIKYIVQIMILTNQIFLSISYLPPQKQSLVLLLLSWGFDNSRHFCWMPCSFSKII